MEAAGLAKKGETITMNEFENAIIVDLPLRGEWIAPNTPGKKVPSHGTDQLGQRYAYDFLQVDSAKKGMRFYNSYKLQYYIFGVPLKKCYCWGKEIYAPCDGKVVDVKDGFKERLRVHLLSDMFVLLKNAFTFNPEKEGLQPVIGNYIIMECANNVYALFAHLSKGSITVSVGEKVNQGQILGKVGHSGNSTAPHLHFQLMDSTNLLEARGIPCAFRNYEIRREDTWQPITNGVPKDIDRIRFNG